MRRIAPIAALAMLALAPSALGAPSGSFSFSAEPPDRAAVGEQVEFTTSGLVWDGAGGGTVAWTFGDGSGETGETVQHAYGEPGSYAVSAVLANTEGGESTSLPDKTLRVNARPVLRFSGFAPLSPRPGDEIQFSSDSSDPDGDPVAHLWAFGDETTSPNRNPLHSFSSAGTKVVRLTISDGFASVSDTQEVTVFGPLVPLNLVPVAGFAFGPRSARVGDPVEFSSSSYDRDGRLREQTWDLDGDGEFDDGRGPEVLFTFITPGEKAVRLRVEDDSGSTDLHQRSLTVTRAAAPPPGFLRPTPIIRFSGQLLARGTRVNILGVRAPRGTLVRVACKGKGCPAKQRRKRIKKGAVRFRNYERFLRAGVRIEIYMRKPKTIGQYTRYRIRAGKLPIRVIRCLRPGKPRPVRCGF